MQFSIGVDRSPGTHGKGKVMTRSVRVSGVLIASVIFGASIQPVLAGIYGSICDPGTFTDPCPSTCSNYCQIFGSPSGTLGLCMLPNSGVGPFQRVCVDAFRSSCSVTGCPTNGWYCLGIAPPVTSAVGRCVCVDSPANSCH